MGTEMRDKTPLHRHSRSETGREDGAQLSSEMARGGLDGCSGLRLATSDKSYQIIVM